MNSQLRDRLIKLNAELIIRENMPSIDPRDYKNIPLDYLRSFLEMAQKADKQVRAWALELSDIRRDLDKSL